jgi:hypothetical protein
VSESPPIIIRQSARYDIALRAHLAIAKPHASDVKFASAAGAKDGWIECDLIDISTGGVGLITRLFVPRRVLAKVRVFSDENCSSPVLECTCRIQRVIMTDRRPAYLLGTSFEGMTPAETESLERLFTRLNAE